MGKNKRKRWAELIQLERVLQPRMQYHDADHALKGKWSPDFFGNNHPLVLEAGCGKGEYTIALAQEYPEMNFLGIDIKGARMWRGAKTANEQNLRNAGFLRARLELMEKFFAVNEVTAIWLTFPDPHPGKSGENRRLTSPDFLDRFDRILKPGGILMLKTDSYELFEYSKEELIKRNKTILFQTADLYGEKNLPKEMLILTTYEHHFLKEGKKICFLKARIHA